MQRSQMQSEEVAQYGKALYEAGIRAKVETPENIGKMVIIDVETGEYAIDDMGLEASNRLHDKHPGAPSMVSASATMWRNRLEELWSAPRYDDR